MKKKFLFFLAICGLAAFSCSKPVDRTENPGGKDEPVEEIKEAPDKPGAISKEPADLNIEAGSEFTMSVQPVENADSYNWVIADSEVSKLSIIGGQGTSRITLRAGDVSAIVAENTIGVSALNEYGASGFRYFPGDITITAKAATFDYKTKKFGAKTWMVENCRETGMDGKLGIAVDLTKFSVSGVSADVLERLNAASGRYYTWYEAMTGISNCTPDQCPYVMGYEGKDDAGNSFKINNTLNGEGEVQIKGCCPEGWHVANTVDWWDLITAIKDEYKVPDDFAKCGYTFTGGHDKVDPCTAETFFNAGCTVKNMGNVGAWLRGGNGRIVDGGVWLQANETASDAGQPLDIFTSGAAEVGFDWFPCGFMRPDGTTFNSGALGKWGYVWFTSQVGDTFARSLVISGTSLNLSMKNASADDNNKASHLPVRCVKNY